VEVYELHDWRPGGTAQAIELQRKLAVQVSRSGKVVSPRYVAGVDMSFKRGDREAVAAVVVLSYPELEVVETRVVRGSLDYPYVPGLLSFRELPLTLAACRQLSITPDLFLVDGQGIAHPRRLGIASHLGLCLDVPTVGCAKSRLIGECKEPGLESGSYSKLVDSGETIGAALRSRAGVRPVYVSIGHKIDLPDAICWVMECCRGYRLPEPTRQAHRAANEYRISEMREIISARA
jgi:deoxyribonuclease V